MNPSWQCPAARMMAMTADLLASLVNAGSCSLHVVYEAAIDSSTHERIPQRPVRCAAYIGACVRAVNLWGGE